MDHKPGYYAILEVAPTASPQEIKKAFHALAMRYHPDHNPGDRTAAKKFQEIHDAYDVLKDALKRDEYDRALRPSSRRAKRTEKTVRARKAETLFRDSPDPGRFAIAGILLLYAAVLIAGGLLLDLPFSLGLLALCAFVCWLARDEINDFIADLSVTRCNGLWLIVLILVFSHSYLHAYQHVFYQYNSLANSQGNLPLSVFRIIFFIYWLASGPWHTFFVAILILLILSLFKKGVAISGWFLLAIQVGITTLIRYDAKIMSGFVLYYEPLFTIAPLKPAL